MSKITIKPDLCTKCGTCVDNCPVNIFNQDDTETIPLVKDEQNCVLCGECVTNCPGNAIKHADFE